MHATPDAIERIIDWEKARTNPPSGFPPLPEIPGGRYISEDFYQLEQQHVWKRSWLCAGREEGLKNAGDYRLFTKAGPPILLVRDKDGTLRAFFITCRHRGAPVVRDDAGNTGLLRCQYHSWSYGLNGRLIGVPDERDFPCLNKADRGLIEVRCETWAGLIFINLDRDAMPLLDYLGPIASELACAEMDKLRVVQEKSYVFNCNWKAAADAFLEVYHVNTIHPTNAGIMLDSKAAAMGLMRNGHSRMATRKNMNLGLNFIEQEGAPDIKSLPDFYRHNNVAYGIFPNFISPVEPTGIPILLFWPRGLRQTEMQVIYIGLDWGEGERPAFWDWFLPLFDQVLDEDLMNLEPIQASLDSGAFTGMMINYQERRIYWLHEEIDRCIGPENLPEGLAVEQVLSDFVETPLQEAAE